MPYATLQDLIERAGSDEIIQVGDRDDDGAPDPDVVEAALAGADSAINGYLAVAYSIPLASVPDLVRTWATSIARYTLHRQGAPDYVVRDWKDAMSSLKDVAAGRLKLYPAGVDEPQPSASNADRIGVTGPDPVFSAEKLEGWL